MEQPHPIEKTKELAAEVDRGRSPRTPLLAITGVTVVVGVIFAVLVTIALVLYFVYGGK
jgi:cell division protein FtsX